MKTARPNASKVLVLTALLILFSCAVTSAQDATKEPNPNTASANDSVVLLVNGHIKSGDKKVWRSTVDVRDTSGNIIATTYSHDGKFTVKVPVAYPKQAFTIEVHSNGYKRAFVDNYVWSYGSVVEIDMKRSVFGTPSRCYRSITCPNF